jgi:quercetin dioxygenase-like cupin family protein
MPRPRRSHLFALDAVVLDVGSVFLDRGHESFYGLEVARLLEDEWQRGRRCYRLTTFGRESVVHARLGRRVFGRADARPEVKLRRVQAREARAREARRREATMASDFTARRVVTGHDDAGKAVIVSDGPPERTIRANGFGVATWLWLDGSPATVDDGGDEPEGAMRLEPPAGGCSVRIIRFPGASEGGGDWISVEGDDPERPGMHATDTLDFMAVVDGRIVLGLDDGEHELGPGDVVIQRGNVHRWRVVGDDPCTYVVCMMRPDPSADAARVALVDATTGDGDGPRRVVAASGTDGRSFALADGAPPSMLSPGGDDAVRLVELWQTGGALRAPDQGGDPEGGWELEPRGGGIAFRSVRLPAGHDPGEAGWHTTATIDVNIVLSGRVELSLPGTPPVVLGPGEAVVQRGTNHKWQPVGDEAAEWVALMIAVPDSGT